MTKTFSMLRRTRTLGKISQNPATAPDPDKDEFSQQIKNM
jgi:hypothetical protein